MSSSAKKIITKIIPKRKSRSKSKSLESLESKTDDRPRKKKSSLRAKVQNAKPKLNPHFRRKRSDVNAKNAQGLTPLHVAVLENNVDGVRDLLSRKDIDINAEDRRHRTPLIVACENNQTDIALKLIKHNADLTVWDENFDTPLHHAFRKANRTVAERIVERAKTKGQLKELATEPNWNWVAPIHEAAKAGHTDLVKKCLDEALLSEKDDTGKRDIDQGFKDDHGHRVSDNRHDILDLRGENDDSLLHIASSNGHVDLVKMLIDRGARVDCTNWDLRTPLHLACIGNHSAVVQYLVDKKANQNRVDVDQLTPLQVAANSESFDVIIAILDRHYNINNKHSAPTAVNDHDTDNHDTVSYISEGGKSSTIVPDVADINDLDTITEEDDEAVADTGNGTEEIDESCGNENDNESSAVDAYNDSANGDANDVHNNDREDNSEPRTHDDESADIDGKNNHAGYREDGETVDPQAYGEESTTHDMVNKKTTVAGYDPDPMMSNEHVAEPPNDEKDEFMTDFLHWVVIENKANVLKLLLRYRYKMLNDVTYDDIKKYMSHAAKNGHTETVGVLIRWKPEVVDSYDDGGMTPLHHAAAHGHDGVVHELAKSSAAVNATTIDPVPLGYPRETSENDDRNDTSNKSTERTALHFAAANGWARPVQTLVKAGADIDFSDKNGATPLHLACIGGHLDAVKQLVELDVDLFARDHRGANCVEYAADGGNERVAYFLLNHRDWKILMSSSSWDEFNKDRSTPMKKLIERMPDVAQYVMDKCIDISPYVNRKDEEFWIEFYYEFLEDSFSLWEHHMNNKENTNNNNDGTEDETPLSDTQPLGDENDGENETHELHQDDNHFANETPIDEENPVIENETSFTDQPDETGKLNGGFKHDTGDVEAQNPEPEPEPIKRFEDTHAEPGPLSPKSAYDDDGYLKPNMRPYSTNSARMVKNHPLIAMVKYERVDLLTHPLVVTLLNHKWSSLGRYVFWPSLILYIIFLIILTGYVFVVAPEFYYKPTNDSEAEWYGDGEQRWVDDIPQASLTVFAVNGHWVILILAILHLFCEMILLIIQKLSYLRTYKLVECTMYLLAILFVIPLPGQTEYQTGISFRLGWQWQCGAVAVCLAWINFIMFLRRFSFLGLYVLMFTDILRSFLKFIFILFCFITAFAFAFYMLLLNQPPHNLAGQSILKTMAGMMGDFDFVGIFHSQNYLGTENKLDDDEDSFFLSSVFYKPITYIMFGVFVTIMAVIVVNLLIGLAVYDVQEIRRKAKFYRLAMRLEAIMEAQQYLPVCIWRGVMRSLKRYYPNSGCCPKVRRGCSVLTGERRVIKEALIIHDRAATEGVKFRERLLNHEYDTGVRQRLESVDVKMPTDDSRSSTEYPKRDEEFRVMRDRFDRMERKIDALLGRKKLRHEDEIPRDGSK